MERTRDTAQRFEKRSPPRRSFIALGAKREMSRKRGPQSVPQGFTPRDELSIDAWEHDSIAVSSSGEAFFYVGYRREDQPHDIPYYAVSVAARDGRKEDSRRLVRFIGGTLTFDFFLRAHETYQLIDDRFVALPSGADSYFGVLIKGSRAEDENLTRQLFGATINELSAVAAAFGELTGRVSRSYSEAGRVTFSRSRNNDCDVSACLIPRNFPYLAFEQAQYDWSHISLYGFYRLLAFLCSGGRESPIKRGLLDAGLEGELLHRLIKCGQQHHDPIRA